MADGTGSTQRLDMLARRSRARRAGDRAYGLLLLLERLAAVALVLLIIAAAARASWDGAGAAAGGGRGTMTVRDCSRDGCVGSFAPSASAAGVAPRGHVVLKDTVDPKKGERVPVALRPGTVDVVRTGTAGLFQACLPLGGALVLAAVVIAGGLRLRRTAWVTGAAGLAVLIGAFVTL
jgi:hypothetical protein